MISFLKTHWRLSLTLLVGGGLIALAVVVFPRSSTPATSAVSWTPSSLNAIVEPGGSDTVSVSFTSSRDLRNVVIRVVPELQPYVVAVPDSFRKVRADQTKKVRLHLTAPPADPVLGSFVRKGTIHLQTSTTTLARPLPITLFGLPPDPGEPGEATLEGIDSDGDGVRDDIQRFIALTHSDSARTRAALTQYAQEQLQALVDADSEEDSVDHARAVDHAIECLFYIHDEDAPDVRNTLRAEILNTIERTEAFLVYDAQLGGHVFLSTPINLRNISCAFDPDALPN